MSKMTELKHKETGIEVEVFWELEQRTPEWHKARWGYFGGTGAKTLMINSIDKNSACVLQIIHSMTEDFFPEKDEGFISKDMQRGVELEPLAFSEAIEYTDIDFQLMGWMRRKDCQLGLSPDGMSKDLKQGLEIKCLNANNHNTAIMLKDNILPEHNDQVVEYFAANPFLEKLHFCFYRPEHKFKPVHIVELTRDSKLHTSNTRKKAATKTAPAVMPQKLYTTISEMVLQLEQAERKCYAIALLEVEKMEF